MLLDFVCCPSLLFELTSFFLRFLSFSSSSILLSRFGSYRTSSERLSVRGIYNFLLFIRFQKSDISLVHSCDYSTRRSDPEVKLYRKSFSFPTFSILPSQNFMSTTFFNLFLQNLKQDYKFGKNKSISFFYKHKTQLIP